MGAQFRVNRAPSQRALLEQLSRARSLPQRLVRRARFVLLANGDRTARRRKQKLVQAMAEREFAPLLTGAVVADNAVVLGKGRRGAEGKAVLIAAVRSRRRRSSTRPLRPAARSQGRNPGRGTGSWRASRHRYLRTPRLCRRGSRHLRRYGAMVVSLRRPSAIDTFRWAIPSCPTSRPRC